MRKYISYIGTTVTTAMFASQMLLTQVFAKLQDPPTPPGLASDTGSDGIKSAILKILTYVLDLITIVAVVFVIVAGVRLIISGGDEGEKDKAKKTIIYVIVGIIVVLFARVIVTFFSNIA